MSTQQFFYSLFWAIAILIAFGIGILGSAVVLQKSIMLDEAETEWIGSDFPQARENFEPRMVSIGREKPQFYQEPESGSESKYLEKTAIAQSENSIREEGESALTTSNYRSTIFKPVGVFSPYYEIEDATLNLFLPKNKISHQAIKRALTRLLLSDYMVPASELLSTRSISTHNVPFLYGKVVDQNNQAMRYPADVYRFIDYLLAHPEKYLHEAQDVLKISLPLKPRAIGEPIHKYQQWVSRYAKQFSVNPALVFAIMETESGFDPLAVSRSNALGLMQLKPEAAGQDVYRYIDFKTGEPEPEELFDSQNNIRMGTAYLGMLQNEYLAQIRNKLSKKILAIAAYNGGLSTVLKLFGDNKESAIERINRLNPKQIYRKLRQQHQSAETRAYLDKVLKAEMKYQKIL